MLLTAVNAEVSTPTITALSPSSRRTPRIVTLVPHDPAPADRREALTERRERQAPERAAAGMEWKATGLLFTSRIGTPSEPDNPRRS